jgi:hypothetical protein
VYCFGWSFAAHAAARRPLTGNKPQRNGASFRRHDAYGSRPACSSDIYASSHSSRKRPSSYPFMLVMMGKAIARVLHAPHVEDVEASEADFIQAAGTDSCIRDRTATQSPLALAKPTDARSSDSNPDLRGPLKGRQAGIRRAEQRSSIRDQCATSTGLTCRRLDALTVMPTSFGASAPAPPWMERRPIKIEAVDRYLTADYRKCSGSAQIVVAAARR